MPVIPRDVPTGAADRASGTGAGQAPLRIGLMLRAIDDVDGQGIYIRKLCDALFEVDTRNEYVAFYSRAGQADRYRDRPNVREVVLPGRSKLLWDQVLVPREARR
jgi:hypothetical protein